MKVGFVEALQRGGMQFLFVFLVLALLYVCILVSTAIIKRIDGSQKAKVASAATTADAQPAQAVVTAPGPVPTGVWGGSVKLKNVDEQTAAMLMAIVSDQSGIPLAELEFKSIALVEDDKQEDA